MAYELPKNFFPHAVSYRAPHEGNGWKPEEGKEDIVVSNVKISASNEFSSNRTENKDLSRATLFIHPTYSSFTDFEVDGSISYRGQVFKIRTILPFTQPYSERIHHWKLELI